MDHGHIKANVRVAENLYRKATGDGRESVTAAIFWMKARAGWRETSVQQIGGALDMSPIRIERIIVDPRNPEAVERYVRRDVGQNDGT